MGTIKKKITAVILCAVMAGMLFVPSINAEAEITTIPEGYTPIYTIEDLYGINSDLGGNYILMNDIDLSATAQGGAWDTGHGWTPISGFIGIFDGNGYRIKNMTIYGEESLNGGLFDSVYGGTVKNLALTNIDISLEGESEQIGGLVGHSRNGKIESCYVTGSIKAKSGNVGGIVGKQDCGVVKNCYSDVDITAQSAAAGITGYSRGVYYNGVVENCYVIGTIATQEGNANVIAYDPNDGLEVRNCYFMGTGTDQYGKKLSEAQMNSAKCFTGFDFNTTWVVEKNSSYPYPQLRSCMQVRTESIELLSKPDKTSYYTTDTLDLTGATLKINYEDNYSVTVPLTESMLTYKMEEGTQVVTVEYNGCTTGFEIEVEKLPESLTITDKKTKLEVSSSYEYKVKYVGTGTVTFASSNPQILRVDKTTGKATAKKAGTATITIKAGNLTESIEVKVVKKKVKESLTIIAKKAKLKVGSSYKYKVKYVGDGAVTYSSSDSKKLKINKTTGKATAKKAGTATITIKAGSLSKKIKVKVVK